MENKQAGVWVKASERLPKEQGKYFVRSIANGFRDYIPLDYLKKNTIWWEWLDEQPIPVNQDSELFWNQIINFLDGEYCKNPSTTKEEIIRELQGQYSIQLKSSPSPTPVNEKEVQAEWEFLIIMRENYEAAKRGSEEDFAGTTKKEAVIEIYEDLIDIIKNLPLKRSGKEQQVIDYVNNLPQPSTPVQDEKEIGQGN